MTAFLHKDGLLVFLAVCGWWLGPGCLAAASGTGGAPDDAASDIANHGGAEGPLEPPRWSDDELRQFSYVLGQGGEVLLEGPRPDRRMEAVVEATAGARSQEALLRREHEDERLREAFEAMDPDSAMENDEDYDPFFDDFESDGLEFLEPGDDPELMESYEAMSGNAPGTASLLQKDVESFFEGTRERFLDWLQDEWKNGVVDEEDGSSVPHPLSNTSGLLLELFQQFSSNETTSAGSAPPEGIDELDKDDSDLLGEAEDLDPDRERHTKKQAAQAKPGPRPPASLSSSKTQQGSKEEADKSGDASEGHGDEAPAAGAELTVPVPVPAKITQFKEGMVRETELWRKAKLTNVEIIALKKMEAALSSFKQCLSSLVGVDSVYSPAEMKKTFGPIANVNPGQTPNFEKVTNTILNNYVARVAPEVSKVMGQLASAKLPTVKAIVEGNMQKFTVKNACEATWVEHISDQVHGLYKWIITQKGFGAASCGDKFLIQGGYTGAKAAMLELSSAIAKNMCKYWKIIEVKAMKWISYEVGSFLLHRPQAFRFLSAEELIIAQKCFNRTTGEMSSVKGYVSNLKVKMVNAASFQSTKSSISSTVFIRGKEKMEEEEVVVQVAEAALRNWIKAFEPVMMSSVVHPILSESVNLMGVICSQVQSAMSGMFGLIPYAGGIMYNLVSQALVASQNFLAGKLVDIGMMSVSNLWASIKKAENSGANLQFIARMAAKGVDYAMSASVKTSAAEEDIVGVNTGVKSQQAYQADPFTEDVTKAIFAKQPKHLQPLSTMISNILGTLRASMWRIKRKLAACDRLSQTLQNSFGAAKWDSDQSRWAPSGS